MTTKIHAVVDANGNPIALKLSEGQAHDGRSADDWNQVQATNGNVRHIAAGEICRE
jgi:transposase